MYIQEGARDFFRRWHKRRASQYLSAMWMLR